MNILVEGGRHGWEGGGNDANGDRVLVEPTEAIQLILRMNEESVGKQDGKDWDQMLTL